MTSAYPVPVDELTDRVREHARKLRAWPSRNQVMKEFRVGGPKATAALDALRAAGFDPTRPDQPADGMAERPVPPLHAVPDLAADDTADDTDTGTELDIERDTTRVDQGNDQSAQVTDAVSPGTRAVRVPRWPILLIALGAFVSIWGGWVGLGELAGFGPVRLLPGIVDEFVINSAITLPLGVEAYAAYALWVWLAPAEAQVPARARRFACWSSIAALGLGVFGQATYHLLVTAGVRTAPWPVVTFVSCLPVLVLGAGTALAHLTHRG
jgi:hypothetical protein